MDRIRFLPYKGLRIFYQDFSGLRTRQEVIETIAASRDFASQQAPNSLFALSDFSQTYYDREVIRFLKSVIPQNDRFVRHEAVVGLSPMTRIIFNSVRKMSGRNFYAAQSLEEGKEWLFEQSKSERQSFA